MFGGGDETGGGCLVGLGVGEVGDGVPLDQRRRHGSSRSGLRGVGQQVAGVVGSAEVATTALLLLFLLLLMAVQTALRHRQPTQQDCVGPIGAAVTRWSRSTQLLYIEPG